MTETMTAAYPRRRRPGNDTAHLILGDADTSVCGVQRGDPAPAVTCTGCANKWAYSTDDGKRAVRTSRTAWQMFVLRRVMGHQPPGPPRARQQPPPPDPANLKRRIEALNHLTALARLLGHDDLLNWQNDGHDPPRCAEQPAAESPCGTERSAASPGRGDARGAAPDARVDRP